MNKTELRVRVLLTMQVALLGMVTGNMRSALVAWNETEVRIRLVFEGSVLLEEQELASEIESEVISHLPDHFVQCRAESCLEPEKVIPIADEVFVFQRAHSQLV